MTEVGRAIPQANDTILEMSAVIATEQRRLGDEITDLSNELAAIVESAANGVPDDEHDAEGSTIGYERARVQALLDHAKRHLLELDEVAGLAPDARGLCTSCGDSIPIERLMALPSTRTCTACARRSL